VLAHLVIAALYLARLDRLGVSPLTNIPVIAGTVVLLTTVPLLARMLLGGSGMLTWVASAGLLGAVLAAAASWPILLYSVSPQASDVNIWGKWAYVAVTAVVAAGLCVMWGRTGWTMFRRSPRRSRKVRVLAVTAIVTVILAAMVPDAVSESGLASPHATGLTPSDLFGLFDATYQLLDWLLLGLAIVVIMGLPFKLDSRPAARDMALPVALMLLYWNDRWLYLPVTAITGIFLIRYLMMPSKLAYAKPYAGNPENWANDAAADWRLAELVAGQQQALAANSTDALRDSLLKERRDEFQSRLARLTEGQNDLAAKIDGYRRAARSTKDEAFSHYGTSPDPRTVTAGTVTGAVLGVIPASVTMLTTQPPVAGVSYPVLNFFGVTAWYLLTWVGLGWFIGYFLPLLQGHSGTWKAMWIFIAAAGASVPSELIWNDPHDWAVTGIGDLEFLVFFMVTTVIVCDICALSRARLRPTDWVRVHNWRFIATWSAALVAAVGTIVIAFATTTVTDLSQQLTRQPPTNSQHP